MPKPWREVAASPQFLALDPQTQAAAQRQYFNEVVLPRVPQGRADDAWMQFTTQYPTGQAGDRQALEAMSPYERAQILERARNGGAQTVGEAVTQIAGAAPAASPPAGASTSTPNGAAPLQIPPGMGTPERAGLVPQIGTPMGPPPAPAVDEGGRSFGQALQDTYHNAAVAMRAGPEGRDRFREQIAQLGGKYLNAYDTLAEVFLPGDVRPAPPEAGSLERHLTETSLPGLMGFMDLPKLQVMGAAALAGPAVAGGLGLSAVANAPAGAMIPKAIQALAAAGEAGVGSALGLGAYGGMESAEQGGSPEEIAHAALTQGGLGGLLGFTGGAPGGITGKLLAEVGVLGVGGPALQGRMPTGDDLLGGAVAIVGLKSVQGLPALAVRGLVKPRQMRTPEEAAAVDALPPERVEAIAQEIKLLGPGKPESAIVMGEPGGRERFSRRPPSELRQEALEGQQGEMPGTGKPLPVKRKAINQMADEDLLAELAKPGHTERARSIMEKELDRRTAPPVAPEPTGEPPATRPLVTAAQVKTPEEIQAARAPEAAVPRETLPATIRESRTVAEEPAQVQRDPSLMSREELDAAIQAEKARVENIDAEVLGEEGAKRYRKLLRLENSQNRETADAAFAEREAMENALPEAQRNRLFGIGEEYGPTVEDLTSFRSAIGRLDFSSEADLGRSLQYHFAKIDRNNLEDPSPQSLEAIGVVRWATGEANRQGFDMRGVIQGAIDAMRVRYGEDADLMMRSFFGDDMVASPPPAAPAPRRVLRSAATGMARDTLNKVASGKKPTTDLEPEDIPAAEALGLEVHDIGGDLYATKPGNRAAAVRAKAAIERVMAGGSTDRLAHWEAGRAYGYPEADIANYFKESWGGHRKAVSEALAAGKLVPPEVLKDYPDLAPKAEAPQGAAEAPKPRRRVLKAADPIEVSKPVQRTTPEGGTESVTTVRDTRAEGAGLEIRAEHVGDKVPSKLARAWGVWDPVKKAWLATKQTWYKAVTFAKENMASNAGFLTIRPGEKVVDPNAEQAALRARAKEMKERGKETAEQTKAREDRISERTVEMERAQPGKAAPIAAARPTVATLQAQPIDISPEGWMSKAERTVADMFNRLGVVTEAAKKAGTYKGDESDLEFQARRFSSTAGDAVRRVEDEIVDPWIKRLKKAKLTTDDIHEIIHSQHADERNAYVASIYAEDFAKLEKRLKAGKITQDEFDARAKRLYQDGGSGMTNADAAAAQAKWKGNTEALSLARDMQALTKKTLALKVEYGELTQKAADRIGSFYRDYAPLKRVREGAPPAGTGARGLSMGGRTIKRTKGSDLPVKDITSQILTEYVDAVIAKERSHATRALLETVEAVPSSAWEVEQLKAEVTRDQWGNTQFFDPTQRDADNVVRAYRDGKTYMITLHDKGIAEGMKTIGVEKGINILDKVGRFYNGMQRGVHTQYNPNFPFTNFPRDIQTMFGNVTSEFGITTALRSLGNVPRAQKAVRDWQRGKRTGWAGDYDKYLREGGKASWSDRKTVEDRQKQLVKKLQRANHMDPLAVAKAIGEVFDCNNDIVEMGTRFAVAQELNRSGKAGSSGRTALYGRGVTVDFMQYGKIGPALGSHYLFAKANISGNHRLMMAAKKGGARAAGVIGGTIMAGYLESLYAHAVNEEEYNKLAPWERGTNWVIMLRNGGHIKGRAAYGYNVFKALGNLTYDVQRGKDVGVALGELMQTVTTAFSPLGDGNLLQVVLPTTLDLPADLVMNKDWADRDIRPDQPQYAAKKPPSSLYFKRVRPQTKAVTSWLNRVTGGNEKIKGWASVSPEDLDYILDTLGGGIARFGGDIGATATSFFHGDKPDPRNVPFLNIFYAPKSEYAGYGIARDMLDESARKIWSPRDEALFRRYVDEAFATGTITYAQKTRMNLEFSRNQYKANASLTGAER